MVAKNTRANKSIGNRLKSKMNEKLKRGPKKSHFSQRAKKHDFQNFNIDFNFGNNHTIFENVPQDDKVAKLFVQDYSNDEENTQNQAL